MIDNTLENLLKTVQRFHPEANLKRIEKAYEFAKAAHEGQLRKSGEAYINHPLGTALTLAEMQLNEDIVIAGLLHDIPEDTNVSLEEIKKHFGSDVASIVKGITKIGTIKYRGMERYAENLRKMFVAIAKDLRVVIVKFADRLYNLKTLHALPKEKQLRIATETLEIYAPIAGRLGMGEMKDQLEDEGFRYALPEEYTRLRNLIIDKFFEKNQLVKKHIKIVERELKKAGIEYIEVQGRAKRLYSLYKKLLRYNNDIEKIYDLVALRIIVKTVADCYAALGIVHKRWSPLKGRIKDYISQPKPNGYQSLHTTVFTDDGNVLEIQIRTLNMHTEAEYGIAAHWQYKTNGRLPIEKIKWIKELAEWQNGFSDHREYLESLKDIKLDILQNRIFVFTPKGDVIELPENATPVDFAYLIHTDIGNTATGALINGKMTSLDSLLKNADVVEIITDKRRKNPNPDWAKFVKTQLARARIRSSSNRARRKK